MSIRVLLFASLAELTGASEMELDASDCPDVGSVYRKLAGNFPALKSPGRTLLMARNAEFAVEQTAVQDGDEIAFFPPVSGG